MESVLVQKTAQYGGYEFPFRSTITADGAVIKTPVVAAAKTGQLTTRTDNNTGTLTMDGGHGILTGDRIDLYWAGGIQRGITVGTVSVNSVPFDLGVGDNLPTNLTAITAMVCREEPFVVTGDDAKAILLYSDQPGMIVFAQDDDTEIAHFAVGDADPSGSRSYIWTDEDGSDNPLEAQDVAKVFFSHGTSDGSANMRAIVLNE